MLGIGAAACAIRPDRWVPKPLPPPPPEVVDFTKIIVPMAFYSHVRKVTLIDDLGRPCRKEEILAAHNIARQLADEIDYEVLGYTPVA
jgi:hypothetical protein